nr:PD-(D/E)XK nuclease family protein [Rickettsiaceae bacterium]
SQLMSKAIAKYIKNQMDSGVILASTKRKISAGDIMILVRKRSNFVYDLISALHEEKIDVSGVDRLLLSDSVTSKDLISLAKFVLQPFDDLNLAALLKSPFFGISDAFLKELILANKELSLWKKCPEDAQCKLNQFIEIYKAYSAADFYHVILNILSYKKQLIEYGVEETEDVINEFLTLVGNFVKDISLSLQEFVIWFARKDAEVKRSVENSGKVRIMTIHGSKGLQAPVVIVADTASISINSNKIIWNKDDIALWNGIGGSSNKYFIDCKNYNKDLEYQEYLRLLYVAMTRAEDILLVTSHTSAAKSPQDGSWYDIAYKTMLDQDYKEKQYDFLPSPALIYENYGLISENSYIAPQENTLPMPLIPIFAPKVREFLGHSQEIEVEDSSAGLLFGNVFHKVMEDIIRNKDFNITKDHPVLSLLPESQRSFISSQISKILTLEEFVEILKMELLAEVSFGVVIDGQQRSGRIDLLAMDEEKIIIIDYKTGYKDRSNFLDFYEKQLCFYKEAIGQIYPNRKVFGKILWLGDVEFQNFYNQ